MSMIISEVHHRDAVGREAAVPVPQTEGSRATVNGRLTADRGRAPWHSSSSVECAGETSHAV